MNSFMKMCVGADIEDAIDFLKQMNSCVQDGDIAGAEHFLDRATAALTQVEEGLVEANTKAVAV